jgi:hypothetical protein
MSVLVQAGSGSIEHTADRTTDRAAELAEIGFLHIPGFIPADRVEEFKQLAKKYGSISNTHETPIFEFLINERRTFQLVQGLFREPIFYYGWCGVRPGLKPEVHHYHDDAKGSPIGVEATPIEILNMNKSRRHDAVKDSAWPNHRLFIYLDDHVDFSGGTKIRERSHRRYDLMSAKGLKTLLHGRFREINWTGTGYVNPRIRPGDAVLFNLKCKHSGYFVRLRWPLENVALPVAVDNMLKRIAFSSNVGKRLVYLIARPFPDLRTAIHIDFCTDSDWARGFQYNRITTPNAKAKRQQVLDCARPEFVERMKRSGVPILKNPVLSNLERFLNSGTK